MEESELAQIRQQRLAQLKAEHGARGNVAGAGDDSSIPGAGGHNDKERQQQEAKAREAEMRNSILSTVLTQEARARLATLGAAKPDRARMVEDIIISNTRMGAIRGKVDEDKLKELLERVNSQAPKRETRVQYERRRVFDDDDDEDLDED